MVTSYFHRHVHTLLKVLQYHASYVKGLSSPAAHEARSGRYTNARVAHAYRQPLDFHASSWSHYGGQQTVTLTM